MPLTNQQKQAAFRKRRAALGQMELRGIWVTDEEARAIKEMIKEKLKKLRTEKT